eukprot:COSAG01_NODE_73192_length_251_cov_0.473684_1_plen_32_part_10
MSVAVGGGRDIETKEAARLHLQRAHAEFAGVK